jgi:hypothetical protein
MKKREANLFNQIKFNIYANYKAYIEKSNPPELVDYRAIPIVINNFNRLEFLLRLLKSLTIRGYRNIVILDNLSTFPPLLSYYESCPHDVIRLEKNFGEKALWKSGFIKKINSSFFAYTDPDVEIIDECPDDFLDHFRNILIERKLAHKVGFSLKIDDLPNHYPLSEQVYQWEKNFYTELVADNLYRAPIDTTFALYRPRCDRLIRSRSAEIYRVGIPYQLRHLPWYVNPENLSEEEQYYIDTCKINGWMKKLVTQ